MSLQAEVYEALCSALYQMPFSEFLGEKDLPDGRAGWFHLGEKPKDIRVEILKHDKREEVDVTIQWRNYFSDGRDPLLGQQVLKISTYAATQAMLGQPTTAAVTRVLEIYRDVLEETGVAGKIADLAPVAEDDVEE